MDALAHRRWLRAAILVGLVYLSAGIIFSRLANTPSNHMRIAWRLAAWSTGAVALAIHIAYEHFRLRNSPLTTALHASAATALGAFDLAVAANVKGLLAASSHQRLLALALVAWPALTAVPAFVVAFTAAAVLARTRRRGEQP